MNNYFTLTYGKSKLARKCEEETLTREELEALYRAALCSEQWSILPSAPSRRRVVIEGVCRKLARALG